MSAIDTTFHFVRNPTAINGLQTTYVSKRGSDVSGDGTAQNPYASIAKATSIASAATNLMLDDAVWSQQRTLNNRAFRWWGNGRTEINSNITTLSMYSNEYFYNLKISGGSITTGTTVYAYNCIIDSINTLLYQMEIYFGSYGQMICFEIH